MRLMLVADDSAFARCTKNSLIEKGFHVEFMSEVGKAQSRILTEHFHLIVVDLAVSDYAGLMVCKSLRKQGVQTPILFLGDVGCVEDCIAGLDAGANDYLLRPFDISQLDARIRVILGRKQPPKSLFLKAEDLVLDPVTRQVKRGEREVELTPREYALLEFLMRHQGRVLSREVLRDHVWKCNFDTGTNVVDVYINYLRRKIDSHTALPLIRTVRGVGYTLQTQVCA